MGSLYLKYPQFWTSSQLEMKRVLYFWKIFEILIYLKELMKSFVSTKFKSMGSFQQILESLMSPPPQTRFTLKKTVSFRKLLVLWWTLPQVFIKSWFASLYLLCKFMYYFWSVISRLILLSHKSISILKVKNARYWWAFKWTISINEKTKFDF